MVDTDRAAESGAPSMAVRSSGGGGGTKSPEPHPPAAKTTITTPRATPAREPVNRHNIGMKASKMASGSWLEYVNEYEVIVRSPPPLATLDTSAFSMGSYNTRHKP
jgi:hypothetical protein